MAALTNGVAQDPIDPNARGGSSGAYQTRPFNPISPWDMANVDQWQHVQQPQMPPGFPGAPPSGNTGISGGRGFPNSSFPGGGGVVPSRAPQTQPQSYNNPMTNGGINPGGMYSGGVLGGIDGSGINPNGMYSGGVLNGPATGATQYAQGGGYQFGGVRPRFGGMLLRQLGV